MSLSTTKVFWALKANGACADDTLERQLPEMPPSTVRGARKRLERVGVVKCVGRKDGRKVWALRRGL